MKRVFQDDLIITSKAITPQNIKQCECLYHVTSETAAKKILNSGIIYGLDRPSFHANFSACAHNPYIAREMEIALRFKWMDKQEIITNSEFGIFPSSLKKNTLYHLFLPDESYWQTILPLGSAGLIFAGIEDSINARAQPQSFFLRLLSGVAREKHDDFLHDVSLRNDINEHCGIKLSVQMPVQCRQT